MSDFLLDHPGAPFAPGPEQKDRADYRHNEPGWMKRRARRRFGKHPSNQTADDGSGNAEDGRPDKPEVLQSGYIFTESVAVRPPLSVTVSWIK